MSTDASNVEDMNIHRIEECLLLSFIASFEDWSNIFRTRVHIIVINDEPVCVLSERTGRLFTHKSLRSCFQHVIRFPLLRRPLIVNIPF